MPLIVSFAESKKMKKSIMSSLCCVLAAFAFTAEAVEMRAQVSVPYKSWLFGSKPLTSEKHEGVRKAKAAVVQSYLATLSPSQQQLLRSIQADIDTNPDKYLTSFRIIAEDADKSTRTVNIVARGNVNEELIAAELKKSAPVNVQASGEGSTIMSLFVARRVVESKVYDQRRTEVSKSSQKVDQSVGQTSESLSESSMKASGGNVVRKAAKQTYGQLSASDFDTALNSSLTSYGYETADYADVQANCGGPEPEQIRAAFMKSDELPAKLRSKVIRAAKSCDVRYFTLGYMNVSAPERDSVSGNIKVVVSLNGMIWDISRKLPRRVGSVGPIQFFGLASDEDTARREALRLAARQAGEVITSQLVSKGLK